VEQAPVVLDDGPREHDAEPRGGLPELAEAVHRHALAVVVDLPEHVALRRAPHLDEHGMAGRCRLDRVVGQLVQRLGEGRGLDRTWLHESC